MRGKVIRVWSAMFFAFLLLGAGVPKNLTAQDAVSRAPQTLVDPATRAVPDEEGFLKRWLILEPIKVSGRLGDEAVRASVYSDYFPNQFTVVPKDGDQVRVGEEVLKWHAVDTLNYNVNLYHFAYGLATADLECPVLGGHDC